MLIFWEQRLVFLATPKAGSTAFEAALGPLADVSMTRPAQLKHMHAQEFETSLQPLFERLTGARFTTVALIREPVSWLASWYRFRLRDEDDTESAVGRIDFDHFAQDYIASPEKTGIGTQTEMLCDSSGRRCVDHLFRYDAIDDLVVFLEDRLGCALTLPRINVPPSADVALSAQTLSGLRRKLAPDFALYHALETDVG